MKKDINEFVQITKQKNNQIKISQELSHEANIYRLIKEFGFCQTKLNKKQIYYQRANGNILPVSIQNIKDTFKSFIKTTDFINMPPDITRSDLLKWFYKKRPIKENELFKYYLSDTLTSEEEHQLKIKTDIQYKATFEINHLLEKLKIWKFKKTIDTIGAFCKGSDLYYKKIEGNKYLVFNHFNSDRIMQSGFDLWTATYVSEKFIGNKKPINYNEIKLFFQLENDFELVKNYIN